MLTAVKYMHSMGIVHGNLTIDNILFVSSNSIENIKICDFRCSTMLKDENSTVRAIKTTLDYTPPEMLKGYKYNKSIDCWNIGVLMFALLFGVYPFFGETDLGVKIYFVWCHYMAFGMCIVCQYICGSGLQIVFFLSSLFFIHGSFTNNMNA